VCGGGGLRDAHDHYMLKPRGSTIRRSTKHRIHLDPLQHVEAALLIGRLRAHAVQLKLQNKNPRWVRMEVFCLEACFV